MVACVCVCVHYCHAMCVVLFGSIAADNLQMFQRIKLNVIFGGTFVRYAKASTFYPLV